MDEEENQDPGEPELSDGEDNKDSEPELESPKDDDEDDDGSETVHCANSGHGPARAFCIDCAKFYCSDCSQGHLRYDVIKLHTLKVLETMSSAEIAEAKASPPKRACTEHKDQVITIYCGTCKEPVCTTCCLLKHKYHDYKALELAGREIHTRLERMLESTEEYIAKQGGVLVRIGATESDIKADFEQTREGVTALTSKICQVVLEDIGSKEAEVLERLRGVRQEAQTNMDGASNLKSDIAHLCNSDQAITKLEAAAQIEARFRRQETQTQETIRWKFTYDQQLMSDQVLNTVLGTIRLTSSPIGLGGVPRANIITMEAPLETLRLEYPGKKVVSGMVVSGNNLYVTHAREPFLWICDLNNNSSNASKMCDVPELEKAMGMAVTRKPNTIVISDRGNSGGKLHFVTTVNLQVTEHQVHYIALRSPRCVTVSKDTGNILVGQEGELEFGVFSADAKGSLQLLRKVKLTAPAGRTFCDAWQVTNLPRGYVALVWDRKFGGTIWWLDEEGQIAHAYDEDLMQGQSLQRPYCAVRDRQGRILVTDYGSNRLQMIGSNKKFQQFLLTKKDGLKSPACLFLDEEAARLYVAHGVKGSREVRIYKWPGSSPPEESHVTDFELSVRLGKLL